MIHLGDITKIRGDEIPPVDCITGGSPCQDLSVAGKRAGLEGERSGLFMEQVRIVKEMRERGRRAGRTAWAVRPRFMVWENVPGAFSSNGGKDFQAVLTEIVKIVEPDAPDVPLPDKGKWPKAGCLYSDVGEWSVAWRVHDAQFWGVPQRRKRIALVADFGGLAAPEILFVREGLSRDPEPRGAEGRGTAAAAGGGVEGAGCFHLTQDPISLIEKAPCLSQGTPTGAATAGVYCLQGNGIDRAKASGLVTKGNGEAFLTPEKHMSLGCGGGQAGQGYPAVYIPDVAHALSARHDGSPQPDKGNGANIVAVHQNASGEVRENDVAYTIGTNANASGRNTPLVYDAREPLCIEMTSTKNTIVEDGISPTLTARMGTGGNQVNAVQTYQEVTGTLNPGAHPGSYNGQDAYNDMLVAVASSSANAEITTNGICPSLLARAGTGGNNMPNITRDSIVRRLTPLECERLQGFPDGWTDIGDWVDSKGKKHKAADSPRYKALGNSIALPFWFWLLRRISAQYERPATLGSLFDGIGGFPLCWERCNGPDTAIWASEIEEFPIAVTKKHFPEEKEDT